ncbi:uncharacterized protein LOC134208877 [Armigeres subalbatus]|uniref:uncharacterized protein LOC134208877 n=1 Tax=Armigeres subalbatus TaxID=124917 RepID=UPI002ED33359
MTTYRKLAAALIAFVLISTGSAKNLTKNANELVQFEGRLQSAESYWYNDVYYWWPWFSDVATVIMIKLKIAIGMAAVYAFGDGYYWKKKKDAGKEVAPDYLEQKYDYDCHDSKPWYKFWDRHKRDLSGNYEHKEHDRSYVEFAFDLFDVKNEDCRRLVICEMDFDTAARTKTKIGTNYKHDLFRKYRGKVPKRRSECKKMYSKCTLPSSGADSETVIKASKLIPTDPKR